jgi:hypothetical protein
MKILYLLNEYPQLSESYIRTEIDYARQMGVAVKVWSGGASPCRYQDSAPFQVGIPDWKDVQAELPDAVHVHYLDIALSRMRQLERAQVPVTVRGHSFDYDPAKVEKLLQSEIVRRIFLFPQFAALHPNPRVSAMTCAIDAARYDWQMEEKQWDLVYRAGAGIPGKDLETFLRVARLCKKKLRFALFLTSQHPETLKHLLHTNEAMGYPAEIYLDRQHEEIAAVARRAGQCFRSHDPGSHPYGMPQSVAEAMRAGCRIVARDGAQEFIGQAGACFSNDERAAEMLMDPLTWNENERYLASMAASEQGMKFDMDHVLVGLVSAWEEAARSRKT